MTPTIDLTLPVCVLDSAQNAGKRPPLTFLELLLNAYGDNVCGDTETRIELITYQTRKELFSNKYSAFPFSGVRPHLESHQSKELVSAFMYT